MAMFSTRSGAAKLALAVVTGLVVLKIVVGIITGSISIIAQAVDSFLDLFAIAITFFAVIIATKPADEEHTFGHGKAEDIAAVVQAVLIFIAGLLIIYSAVRRIITGTTLELTEAGIGVMLVSIIASIFLSRYLLRVSRATDSIALEASARNIAADVYSAAGVLVGLVVIRFTGLGIIDPIIALLVSLVILKSAYNVLRKSFGGLIDVKLPEAEENVIRSAIMEHVGELVDFHALRTRKAGNQRYIDLHLVMPRDIRVEEAHQMCDHLEQDIKIKLKRASVTIHVEPCREDCDRCPVPPDLRNDKT
jgi:cation diffusion facilitator family transporter